MHCANEIIRIIGDPRKVMFDAPAAFTRLRGSRVRCSRKEIKNGINPTLLIAFKDLLEVSLFISNGVSDLDGNRDADLLTKD